MYLMYTIALIVCALILILLWKEERRFRKNITHGLVNKFWLLRERRRFVRFKKELRIRYDLSRRTPRTVGTRTGDISRKGVCLLTYERLKQKDSLNLEIDLPDFSKPVTLTGQVVWTKDLKTYDAQGRRLFYAGVRFFKMRPQSEAMLLTYLNNYRDE